MRAGDLVVGRYELERLAGSGGMGTVYRARDRRTRELVALKWMTGQWREAVLRFEREADTLSRLHHPCIVRYIDHGKTEEDECYIVTEWLEGESLGDRLRRAPVSLAETMALARRVAGALGAMHRAGVVHRDVKPGNVLLGLKRPEYAKLLDFGLVRIADAERELTQAGVMLGTPGYIAPEQARSAKTVDARADVYALGCIIYRCLAGRLPFEGKDSVALLVKTMLEDPPRVSELCEVPAAIDRLVMRMLGRSAHERPIDGGAVLAELEAIEALGELAGPPVEPKRSGAPALGATEQRVLCVVLARPVQSPRPGEAAASKDAVREAVERYGGRVDFLAEGSLLVTLSEAGGAADQAMRAARCALAERRLLSQAPIAVATGWGRLSERWPVGEVVDRAVLLLNATCEERPSLPIRIDAVTAGLIDGRFEVGKDAGGPTLLAERETLEPARTLLGKPTPCVGRDRELSTLEAIFHECVGEPIARAVVVTAPPGLGKSRLRYELVRALMVERGPLEVWIGRGDAMSVGSAFGVIAPAIRRMAGVQEGEPLEERRRKLHARIARHVGSVRADGWATPRASDLQRVTEFVGELVGVPFPDETSVQLRAARADAVLMGDQMKRAWEDLLAAECAAHPLLLVLEDLHWGDLPSVSYVDAALRTLRDAPLMVVALARPEVHETFPRLWAERDVVEMRLGSLGRKAGEQLLEATLGRNVSSEMARKLVDRAAGNAFYLEELIRDVAEGRGDRLPDTVVAVSQARLERLEPEARRVLRAASVFGEAFWKGGVAVLLGGGTEKDLGEWLSWLSDRELITRRGEGKFPGQEEYAFRHALVREAAYATLTPSDCALGHRLAGDWLERSGEAEPVVLAEHFERGGEPGRALGWYRRAAEQALEGHDFGACLDRVARALRCGPDGDVLGALKLLEAEARKWRGESEAAAASALEAMRRLARGSAPWYAAAGEAAHACGTLGDLDRLSEIAGALLIAISRGPIEPGAVVAAERVVIQLSARGRYQLADQLQAPVEAAAGPIATRNPAVRARILQARAERALVAGEAGEHLRLREACATAFDDAGDARNACHARGNLGYAYLEIGAFAEAVPFLRECLATSEHMGLPPVRSVAQHNLGLALARLGSLDEARAMESAAIAASAAQGDRRVEGSSRIYLAAILVLMNDPAAAEREARSAAQLLSSSIPGKVYAVAMLARVLLAQGRPAEALASAAEAMAGLDWLGGIEEGESLVRLVHAEALHATGDTAGAARAIGLARERLHARAAEIREKKWRASFLERIPDNARTLELANEWVGPDSRPSRPSRV